MWAMSIDRWAPSQRRIRAMLFELSAYPQLKLSADQAEGALAKPVAALDGPQ